MLMRLKGLLGLLIMLPINLSCIATFIAGCMFYFGNFASELLIEDAGFIGHLWNLALYVGALSALIVSPFVIVSVGRTTKVAWLRLFTGIDTSGVGKIN